MRVNAVQFCLIPNILQNIFFCVPQKNESHTGLERHVNNVNEKLNITEKHKLSFNIVSSSSEVLIAAVW